MAMHTYTHTPPTIMFLDFSSYTPFSCYTHVVSDTLETLVENSLVPQTVAANVSSTNSKMKAMLSTQQLVCLYLSWDFPLCGAAE